jgi:hypothetical protein
LEAHVPEDQVIINKFLEKKNDFEKRYLNNVRMNLTIKKKTISM